MERLAPLVAERLGALRDKAASQPAGVPFLVRLAGDVGEIEAGTAVRIRGIPVGRVREVQISFDTGAATLDVPVVIELAAGRLTVDGQTPSTPEQTYDAVAALVAKGLRARVAAGGLMGAPRSSRSTSCPRLRRPCWSGAGLFLLFRRCRRSRTSFGRRWTG